MADTLAAYVCYQVPAIYGSMTAWGSGKISGFFLVFLEMIHEKTLHDFFGSCMFLAMFKLTLEDDSDDKLPQGCQTFATDSDGSRLDIELVIEGSFEAATVYTTKPIVVVRSREYRIVETSTPFDLSAIQHHPSIHQLGSQQ